VWGWAGVLVLAVAALLVTGLVLGPAGTLDGLNAAVRDALRDAPGVLGEGDDVAELVADLGYRAVWVPTALVLAWFARWRQLAVYLGVVNVVAAVGHVTAGDAALSRAVRSGVTGSVDVVAVPAWPILVVAVMLTGSLFALLPHGRARRWGWAVGILVLAGVAAERIALGFDPPVPSVGSAVLGCSIAALAFLLLAPEREFPVDYRRRIRAHLELDRERTGRVVAAVRDQLGVEVTGVHPYRLLGSRGSTPCRLTVAGPPGVLFGKLYATPHLRSDRWYKLARVLRYGRLEDEGPFASVRRLAEHEDYLLRLLRDGGVRVPEPFGVVEVLPGREYLLVTEFVPGAVEILEALPGTTEPADDGAADAVVDDALAQVRRLWAAGAAHRDIKPSNVLVQDGRVVLVDVSFGEIRPSRWRQDVDLANMLLVLALLVGPERVVQRAVRVFEPRELAEALAASGSVTVPRQLQRLVDESGKDLPAELRALLPEHPAIRIQRWSARRLLLALATVGGILTVAVLVTINLRAGGLL
jgi:tRNA A-37 threonylcarbamoyl transferase component Bud32